MGGTRVHLQRAGQPLREGELRVRLDEHRAALLTIKRGDQPWPDVNAWRLRLHQEFDEAFASTQLPERPDYAWANEFLLKARRHAVEPFATSSNGGPCGANDISEKV